MKRLSSKSKLVLHRESLRALSSDELATVAGASAPWCGGPQLEPVPGLDSGIAQIAGPVSGVTRQIASRCHLGSLCNSAAILGGC
jgi:hypothetical protein